MTHHWGYVGVATAATLFGISATLNKIVLSDVHPLIVVGLIYLIAVYLLYRKPFIYKEVIGSQKQ